MEFLYLGKHLFYFLYSLIAFFNIDLYILSENALYEAILMASISMELPLCSICI